MLPFLDEAVQEELVTMKKMKYHIDEEKDTSQSN